MVETFTNLIDGNWVPARSGRTFENRNPADSGECIGEFPSSDSADVNAAVAAARRAYDEWRVVPAPERATILLRAASSVTTWPMWRPRFTWPAILHPSPPMSFIRNLSWRG